MPLLLNMIWYQNLECWDPRDRVFAVLAISNDATELAITPNYSDGNVATRVFLDAAIRMLQNDQKLMLLVYAAAWANCEEFSDNSDPTVTSVIPSWTLSPPHYPRAVAIRFNKLAPHPREWLSAAPRFRVNQSILVLKGSLVDRISMSTCVNFLPNSASLGLVDDQWIQSYLKLLKIWAAVLYHLQITFDNIARLCRAIVAVPAWSPLTQNGFSRNENAAYNFWCYYRLKFNAIRRHAYSMALDLGPKIEQLGSVTQDFAVLLSDLVDPKSFQSSSSLTPEEDSAAAEFLGHVTTHGRSFCVTEGSRVCNAMDQARPGDVVAALQGSDRLWILCPVGDRYRLIGDAYVEGLMSGEAYEGVDPDKVDHTSS